MNIDQEGMKRVMEEAAAQNIEAIHYLASAAIQVEVEKSMETGFWSLILEMFFGKKLKKEDAHLAEKWVWEVTGCSDPVEEKTGVIEIACENYEVLEEDKWVGKAGWPVLRIGTRTGGGQRRTMSVRLTNKRGIRESF